MIGRDFQFTRRDLGGLAFGLSLTSLVGSAGRSAVKPSTDAVALAQDIKLGHVSAAQATDAALERIARLNPTVGAVVTVDAALARARAGGVVPGSSPLAGVPTLVKDLVNVRGLPTLRGSRGSSPAAVTAQPPLVDAMEAAGMVIVGKSQTPEYGASPTTEPLIGPITRNPVSIGHIAGGSSGGAAAAVAAGMVAIAHGSDGGGSLRMPASCCGVFALKPSRGRMLDTGGPKPKLELSVPGAVTRTVRDSAAYLSLVEQRQSGAPLPPVGFVTGPGQRKLRIGLNLKTLRGQQPDPEIAKVVTAVAARCTALGHRVRPFRWTFDEAGLADALGTSMLVAMAEIAGAIMQQKKVALGDTGLEPLHIRMAEAGRALSPDQMAGAFAHFAQVQAAYPATFAAFDLILTPTLAQLPVLLGQLDNPARSIPEILAGYLDLSPYTTIQNIAGAPAMSVPLGISRSGLPIGVHFAGPAGSERTLLELAYQLEQSMPWRPGLESLTMSLDDTPLQIEKAFREALGDGNDPVRFARWLATIWADEVMITHEPAMANDGPVPGSKLAEGEVQVFTAVKKALPDYRQDGATVRLVGDVLEFHEVITATLPGGEILRVPVDYRFTLKNGRIVKVHGLFDPVSLKPFSDVVKAAGQRVPNN